MLFFRTALLITVLAASPLAAQDRAQTLADIRQELSVLAFEIQKLNQELSTTSGPQINLGGQSGIDRLNAIEAAVATLTRQTEALQNRITTIVSDGANQIGDLQFRLCELTEKCDLASLPEQITLGGETAGAAPVAAAPQPADSQTAELAVGEVTDFELAETAFANGDYAGAVEKFVLFTQTYPGSPLSADAHFLRGEALAELGDWNKAARAYLESFSGSPQDDRAPEALYKLGLALNELGQTSEGCLMLQEVATRFPGSDQVALANAARQNLSCG